MLSAFSKPFPHHLGLIIVLAFLMLPKESNAFVEVEVGGTAHSGPGKAGRFRGALNLGLIRFSHHEGMGPGVYYKSLSIGYAFESDNQPMHQIYLPYNSGFDGCAGYSERGFGPFVELGEDVGLGLRAHVTGSALILGLKLSPALSYHPETQATVALLSLTFTFGEQYPLLYHQEEADSETGPAATSIKALE